MATRLCCLCHVLAEHMILLASPGHRAMLWTHRHPSDRAMLWTHRHPRYFKTRRMRLWRSAREILSGFRLVAQP